MDYMTIKQTSELWGLSIRRIQTLCDENRVEGATKFGNVWAIPKDCKRPKDGRYKSGKYVQWRSSGYLKPRL